MSAPIPTFANQILEVADAIDKASAATVGQPELRTLADWLRFNAHEMCRGMMSPNALYAMKLANQLRDEWIA